MSTPVPKGPVEPDERQPLLYHEDQDRSTAASPDDVDGSLGQPDAILRPKKTRSKLRIAGYILLVLVVAFVLAVFIKGWIDADDVEVCQEIIIFCRTAL